MEGISLVPVFTKGEREGHEYLAFEHFNEKALISKDGWKIVCPGARAKWELYDLNTDRSEKHNLADKYPERLSKMVRDYQDWAERCMVEPTPDQVRNSMRNKK